jgi:hypothetical protein
VEKSLSLSKIAGMLVMVSIFAFGSPFAYSVRQSSENGSGANVSTWMVLGRSVTIPLTANGKKVMMTREIICDGTQDQLNGGCEDGNYVYLFQFTSASTNVYINIGQLEKGSFTTSSGGVNVCDDGDDIPPVQFPQTGDTNPQELCTEDPTGYPNYTDLSGITFKVKSATAVQFVIPSFPNFEPGYNKVTEGQGITLYVQTHQNASFPIAYPSVGIQ